MNHLPKILAYIRDERKRQDEKWGAQTENDDTMWATVLMEEVGEAAKAALDSRPNSLTGYATRGELFDELIQVAAVACHWAERLAEEFRQNELRANAEDTATLHRAPRRTIWGTVPASNGYQIDHLVCGHSVTWRRSQHRQPTSHHCQACARHEEEYDEMVRATS